MKTAAILASRLDSFKGAGHDQPGANLRKPAEFLFCLLQANVFERLPLLNGFGQISRAFLLSPSRAWAMPRRCRLSATPHAY